MYDITEISDFTATSNYTKNLTTSEEVYTFANGQCLLAGIIIKGCKKKYRKELD